MSAPKYNSLCCIKTTKPGKAINTVTETEIWEIQELSRKAAQLLRGPYIEYCETTFHFLIKE